MDLPKDGEWEQVGCQRFLPFAYVNEPNSLKEKQLNTRKSPIEISWHIFIVYPKRFYKVSRRSRVSDILRSQRGWVDEPPCQGYFNATNC